jgi:hypothetical protein
MTGLMLLLESIGCLVFPTAQLVVLFALVVVCLSGQLTKLRFKILFHGLLWTLLLTLVAAACGSWKLPHLGPKKVLALWFVIVKSVLYLPYLLLFWLCAVRFKDFREELGY